MKNISSYFPVQSKKVHLLLAQLENARDIEEAEEKAAIAEAVEDRRKASSECRQAAHDDALRRRALGDRKVDPVMDFIDGICCDERPSDSASQKMKRKTTDRPNNWEIIALHYAQWGKKNTIQSFQEELGGRSERSADQALRQWSSDLKSKKSNVINSRGPVYGNEIDLLLIKEVKVRIDAGLPVDDATLRLFLIDILESHYRSELLIENDGKFSFGHSWATRFWKRHNMVSRVVTTKMRILPANFDALEEN